MGIHAIVGGQWGDEGKGKIVDHFSASADIVARYQGGANAGHTVYIGDEQYVLHQVPSGILSPGTRCLMGTGMVIDPVALAEEINDLADRGFQCQEQIGIAYNAHLVLPVHRMLDGISEEDSRDKTIGTTRRGIGPAYTDRSARRGIPVAAMLDADIFEAAVKEHLRYANALITDVYNQPSLEYSEFQDGLSAARDIMLPMITDVSRELLDALATEKKIISEGAQGVLLDIDYGSYPYVTSSHPGTSGVSVGLGVPPNAVTRSTGIFKAYCTRVGEGPFPTELLDATGNRLREAGGEYGATTGRPRRCGWFDAVLGEYCASLNGFTDLCITKADVLGDLDEISLCTAYQNSSGDFLNLQNLEGAAPRYETFTGWKSDISEAESFDDFPEEFKQYLHAIESALHAPVSLISTGPERTQLITK